MSRLKKGQKVRQGDVLLTFIGDDPLPGDVTLVERDQGRVILAYGEVTGHAHAIADPLVELFTAADMDEMQGRFLRVEQEAELRHEEHDTIVLPPGNYRVQRQREYTPEQPVYVAD